MNDGITTSLMKWKYVKHCLQNENITAIRLYNKLFSNFVYNSCYQHDHHHRRPRHFHCHLRHCHHRLRIQIHEDVAFRETL